MKLGWHAVLGWCAPATTSIGGRLMPRTSAAPGAGAEALEAGAARRPRRGPLLGLILDTCWRGCGPVPPDRRGDCELSSGTSPKRPISKDRTG
jgi:hypothetical protein